MRVCQAALDVKEDMLDALKEDERLNRRVLSHALIFRELEEAVRFNRRNGAIVKLTINGNRPFFRHLRDLNGVDIKAYSPDNGETWKEMK